MSPRKLTGLALSLAALVLCSCPSGLDVRSIVNTDVAPNKNIGQGFEPGLATSDPLGNDSVLCGAIIPGAVGQPDLQLAFFVFSTLTSAADADGPGTGAAPFVKETPPPLDGNGASDVFVAAVVRSSNPGSTTPNAFTQTIAPVMRHPRCVTCHSFHYPASGLTPAGFGFGGQHTGGDSNGTNTGCGTTCHSPFNLNVPSIDWHAPDPTFQGDLDFRNKTTLQLYNQVLAGLPPPLTGSIPDHLKNDDKIFWAIGSGQEPPNSTNSTLPLGGVPISKTQWDLLVNAWVDGGFLFDTSGAVQDLTLVSRKADAGFNSSGNGASLHPHAIYVPDAGYNPSSTAAQIAGRIHVVFSSDATDLLQNVGVPSVARDVWHATIEVRMNEEPQAGIAEPGKINLLVREDLLERMSRSSVGNPGNGNSDHAMLSNDASLVVFDSTATNLVPAFVNLNLGLPDVYSAQPGTNSTTLVSHENGFVFRGGNDASQNPGIASLGQAVVFETSADNLFPPGPLNGEQNVALSMPPGGTTTLVSVDSTGALGTGGACRRPSVFINSGGAPLVVFESDKTDLVLSAGTITNTQIYLNLNGATQLVTRKGAVSGNGASTRPSISADGKTILFQSAASNLDSVRPLDANGFDDILRFDLDQFLTSGLIVVERISLAADGSDADGSSSVPMVASFVAPPLAFTGGSLGFYRTQATNTGIAVNTDGVLVFLAAGP